jgi:hypothetical protein
MYKECGHDHCKRLDTELPFAAERMPTIHISTTAMDEVNGSRNEIALWLWEVHNAGESISNQTKRFIHV